MKDGRHMLSGEGGTASSPRFKSKRRLEGPDIFRDLSALVTCNLCTRWDFGDRIGELRNRRGQLKNQRGASFLKSWACLVTTANLLFQICPHLSHATSALNGISEIEEAIPDIGEASAFPDVSASVTCRVSFAEITGSLSKCISRHVNNCHMQSQLCRNHGQFVEVPIPNIKEALAFPNVSAPVTCTVSLAEITGNLSKISYEVEST
ncbi:hypothetical protein ACFX2A_047803 [Malus domestica]